MNVLLRRALLRLYARKGTYLVPLYLARTSLTFLFELQELVGVKTAWELFFIGINIVRWAAFKTQEMDNVYLALVRSDGVVISKKPLSEAFRRTEKIAA